MGIEIRQQLSWRKRVFFFFFRNALEMQSVRLLDESKSRNWNCDVKYSQLYANRLLSSGGSWWCRHRFGIHDSNGRRTDVCRMVMLFAKWMEKAEVNAFWVTQQCSDWYCWLTANRLHLFFLWSLYVLPVSAWVLSRDFSTLPQSKD